MRGPEQRTARRRARARPRARAEHLIKDLARERDLLAEAGEALARQEAELGALAESEAGANEAEANARARMRETDAELAAAERRLAQETNRAADLESAAPQSRDERRGPAQRGGPHRAPDRGAGGAGARRRPRAGLGQARRDDRRRPELARGLAEIEARGMAAEDRVRELAAAAMPPARRARAPSSPPRSSRPSATPCRSRSRRARGGPPAGARPHPVAAGYGEVALGAALGDDLEAAARPGRAGALVPGRRGPLRLASRRGSSPLALWVEALLELARRLRQTGVVPRELGAALQSDLCPASASSAPKATSGAGMGSSPRRTARPPRRRLRERNRLVEVERSEREACAHADTPSRAPRARVPQLSPLPSARERQLRQTWRETRRARRDARKPSQTERAARRDREPARRRRGGEGARRRGPRRRARAPRDRGGADVIAEEETLNRRRRVRKRSRAPAGPGRGCAHGCSSAWSATASCVRSAPSWRVPSASAGRRGAVAPSARSQASSRARRGGGRARRARRTAALDRGQTRQAQGCPRRGRGGAEGGGRPGRRRRDRPARGGAGAARRAGPRWRPHAKRAPASKRSSRRRARAGRRRRAASARDWARRRAGAPPSPRSRRGRRPPLADVDRQLRASRRTASGWWRQPASRGGAPARSPKQARQPGARAQRRAGDPLRGAIGQLNREAKKRLQEAFDTVNGYFQRLFTTLFMGGKLSLRDGRIETRSRAASRPRTAAGQEAGHAVAAVGRRADAYGAVAHLRGVPDQPASPICVLDEVDAPLDDANVDRFRYARWRRWRRTRQRAFSSSRTTR